MNAPNVFSYRQFKVVFISAALFSLAYLVINIFVIGGDRFVFNLNNNLTLPLPLINLFLVLLLWKSMNTNSRSRFMWWCMSIGWLFWTCAEVLWTVLTIVGWEIPYPSIADYFWCAGYIPMALGLLARVRMMPKKLTASEWRVVIFVSILVILLSWQFVIQPTVEAFDPQRAVESFLNIYYPMADLVILVLVLNLFFSFNKGEYGFAWKLILLGFILHSISDLLFSYLTWVELYYPNLQPTFLSTVVVDYPYNISYLIWLTGLFALYLTLREYHTVEINANLELATNAHVLLFTNRSEQVIQVSNTYAKLFPYTDPQGKDLGTVLGIPDRQIQAIHAAVSTQKKITDQPVQIRSVDGMLHQAWLSGVASYGQVNGYQGTTFVLRFLMEDEDFDAVNSAYDRSLVPSILSATSSSEQQQISNLLVEYYLALIKALFNLTYREGGAILSQNFLDHLSDMITANQWELKVDAVNIIENTGASIETLKKALPELLAAAKKFCARLTDDQTVDSHLQMILSQFGETVRRNVLHLEKTGALA